jgi:hypothetical protein
VAVQNKLSLMSVGVGGERRVELIDNVKRRSPETERHRHSGHLICGAQNTAKYNIHVLYLRA